MLSRFSSAASSGTTTDRRPGSGAGTTAGPRRRSTAAGDRGPGRRRRRSWPSGRRCGRRGAPVERGREHVGPDARSCPASRRPAVRWSGTRPGSADAGPGVHLGGDGGDALVGLDRLKEGLDHGRILRDVDGDDQRAVDAGTEAVGDEIVGPTLGPRLGQRLVVGDANVEGRCGRAGRRRRWRRSRRSWSRAHPNVATRTPPWRHRALWLRRRPRRLIRCPARPRKAGSSVIEATTMISTMTEMAIPAAVTNGTPATARPSIAMTTVPPAKTTAWPAVADGAAGRLLDGHPAGEASRCRTTMNRA